MRIKKIAASLFTMGMAATPFAHATNGMNLEGYGPVAAAMGGASMAYDNGTAAVMNNPATLGLMQEGSRFDVALGLLAPSITASVPAAGMSADSSATAFWMPAMGYAKKSGQLTYGAGVFSQGGMGTEYGGNTFMAAGSGLPVRSEVGVGRFIIPLAYQMNDKLTVAGSVDYVWASMDLQMALTGAQFLDMAAGGTQTYGSVSGSTMTAFMGAVGTGFINPANPVNWGYFNFSDNSKFTGLAKGSGMAGKIGFTFKVSPQLTIGGTYHSKTSLGDLNASGASLSFNANLDNGMLAGGAASGTYTAMTIPVTGKISVKNFQWPETYGFGMAYQATDVLMLVADYKRIGWKSVMKDFNMTFTADATQANPLAAGFAGTTLNATLNQNWADQNVFQVGAAYKTSDVMTVRGGVNVANNPVPDKYMNPLFPAIAKNHITLGLGYVVSKQSSIDFDYAYVLKSSATNGSGVKVDFGGYSAQLMYGYRF